MGRMVECPKCGFHFLDELTCLRCGHKWKPRNNQPPKVCPNPDCKSPYWDRPRKNKGAKKASK